MPSKDKDIRHDVTSCIRGHIPRTCTITSLALAKCSLVDGTKQTCAHCTLNCEVTVVNTASRCCSPVQEHDHQTLFEHHESLRFLCWFCMLNLIKHVLPVKSIYFNLPLHGPVMQIKIPYSRNLGMDF